MPYCSRNGVKSYYEVSGEGYPFVFMHANPFDRRMFLYQAAHFSTYFKVINIDLRAYGYSDKPATPITMRIFAKTSSPFAGRKARRRRFSPASASVA